VLVSTEELVELDLETHWILSKVAQASVSMTWPHASNRDDESEE